MKRCLRQAAGDQYQCMIWPRQSRFCAQGSRPSRGSRSRLGIASERGTTSTSFVSKSHHRRLSSIILSSITLSSITLSSITLSSITLALRFMAHQNYFAGTKKKSRFPGSEP
jgi:hypothetical protein